MSATTTMLYSCSRCGMPTKFSNRLCFQCKPPTNVKSRPSRLERVVTVGAAVMVGFAAIVAMKLLWK